MGREEHGSKTAESLRVMRNLALPAVPKEPATTKLFFPKGFKGDPGNDGAARQKVTQHVLGAGKRAAGKIQRRRA